MKLEDPEKTTDLPQVTDKLYHVACPGYDIEKKNQLVFKQQSLTHSGIYTIMYGTGIVMVVFVWWLDLQPELKRLDLLLVYETGGPGENHRPAASH
jgi:hypothetical protein